jgi:hypothetical protein
MKIYDECGLNYVEKANFDEIEKEGGRKTGIELYQRILYCPMCNKSATIRVIVDNGAIVKLYDQMEAEKP